MRRVGDRATLLELSDNAAVHAAARAARERYGSQLEEVVPGHETLLLVWRDGAIRELDLATTTDTVGSDRTVTIPVRYDGIDLDDVARQLGVSREEVVSRHSAADYTVAFMGFMPGFPYMIGLPPELELPRLRTPRTDVPTGSVAVAAAYCGIYPRSSPGGWNLLGRTDVVLFDAERQPPALLQPGARVRFEPIR